MPAIARPAESLRKEAESGNAAAQFRLGLMYNDGDLGEKDVAESGNWYLKAAESFLKEAEKDDPDAEWRLGLMYHSGQGVTKSEAEAQKWYLESG
jgi:hypothetical protein